MDVLEYDGAFRLPADDFGASSLNFSEGPVAYNPNGYSLFVVGHSHHQAIAEFQIPQLVNSETITDLIMADAPIQTFATVLNRAASGNTQAIDRIGGLACFETSNGVEMIVNAYEYYDAAADNTHSTLVVRDAGNLTNSAVDGYYSFEGGAGHTAGWISPIPAAWQDVLGGTHITGMSSGIPIIGRTSVGPSAFAFDPMQVVGNTQPAQALQTHTLLDFSLDTPLHADLSNDTRNNDIWTHLSRAVYGFIVPGSSTYMTIGHSGGHQSGVCYKCTQNTGHECGGYCAPDASDYYQHYWLWDVNDLVAAREGRVDPHTIRPYDYGAFSTPFAIQEPQIGGGVFDPETSLLYLTVQRADTQQGTYNNPPVVVAYKVNSEPRSVDTESETPINEITLHRPYPNPFQHQTTLSVILSEPTRINLSVFDLLGRRVKTVADGLFDTGRHNIKFDGEDLPGGTYFFKLVSPQVTRVEKLILIR